jgi:predicted dithiol-disulfide oxidoreductase (DUF899 family)
MSEPRFPNEPPEYRAARDELLDAEAELRRQVERVAAQRRALPSGGQAPEDYVFRGGPDDIDAPLPAPGGGEPVKLSELFAPGQDTLVLYNFMYGPEMAHACPSCTSFLDGLNGNAVHIEQNVSLAVVAKSPLARIREYAKSRDWRHLRLLSSAENTFNHDYHGEDEAGNQNTIIHVFVKDPDGTVRHTYSSELSLERPDPGQGPRHIDLMWPLWGVLDLTPRGRDKDWEPKREYA